VKKLEEESVSVNATAPDFIPQYDDLYLILHSVSSDSECFFNAFLCFFFNLLTSMLDTCTCLNC